MVMVVDGWAVVRDDGRGGWHDVRGGGGSGGRRVAPSHAGVGRGAAPGAERGGGRPGQVGERLIVEEVGALLDEALDDCLVGACGGQGVHSGEVWSHERGPKANGQVLTGHQVQLTVLAHFVQVADDIFEDLVVLLGETAQNVLHRLKALLSIVDLESLHQLGLHAVGDQRIGQLREECLHGPSHCVDAEVFLDQVQVIVLIKLPLHTLHLCLVAADPVDALCAQACCFDKMDALLNKDRDGSLRSHHTGQWHAKIVALNGFGY